jgi:PleD family two-component response regulator
MLALVHENVTTAPAILVAMRQRHGVLNEPLDVLMNSSGHILVVDDEPNVRTLLRRCLEGEGFAVSEAKDGAEMRLTLEREAVSLITPDLNLGKEMASTLRERFARTATSRSLC